MWQAIVDSQILETVRLWLEPQTNDRSFYETGEHSEPVPGSGPRWSLPAVGIQRAFFEVLPKMDLDAPTLKESKLGPIVLFYTKTKRCPVEVRRQAEELVQIWSRPIAKRPVDFRQRRVQHARPTIGGVEGGGDMEGEGEGEGEDGEGDDGYEGSQSQRNGGGRASASQSQGAGGQRIIKKVFDARTAVEENRGRKGARLPVVKVCSSRGLLVCAGSYTAPRESSAGGIIAWYTAI
jgi:transcription factor SPN1